MAALSAYYSVHYVCNADSDEVAGLPYDVFHCIHIERGFSLGKDITALFKLYKYFRANRFAAVHSVTPKAGLLTALAGWMARVPNRIHIFTGQVWATRKGLTRWLLKAMDRLIVRLDTHILVDGKSQKAFLVREGVVKYGDATVFAEGSISGVDTVRFAPNGDLRRKIRRELGIKDDTLVFIFVGRLTREKGIEELLLAFERLASENGDVFLLMVGWDEGGYGSIMNRYPHIGKKNSCYYGSTPAPEQVLNAGDVFVLPTYREGFGTSVLEAAGVGLPAVTSDVYGVLDAVVEGETGLRCRVGDVQDLYQCMNYCNEHRPQVRNMGDRARERVLSSFTAEQLTECWVDFYRSLLSD